MRSVAGDLTISERIALPEDTEVLVEVRGTDDALLARGQSRSDGRQPPLPVSIWVPADRDGTLSAAVQPPGLPGWQSEPISLQAGPDDILLGDILLQREGEPPSPHPVTATPELHALPEEGRDPADEPVVAAVDDPVAGDEPVAADEPFVAAAPEPAEPAEPAEPGVAEAGGVRYLCGDDVLLVSLDDGHATVSVGGIDVQMQAVAAASGARYEAAGDPDTYYWSRGERALIRLAGAELPECERIGADR